MAQTCEIGIIGDFDPDRPTHIATNEALAHAADLLSVSLAITWLPTNMLDQAEVAPALDTYDALWCAPASPYKSMVGALNAIQFARETGHPFLGT